jgi:hypothetical protein
MVVAIDVDEVLEGVKMKIMNLFMLVVLAALTISCGESDLLDDYIVKAPRALAVRVQDPEAQPGNSVSMKLLVGGRNVDQSMDDTVSWFFYDGQASPIGVAGYDQEFTAQIPDDVLDDGAQWVDLMVLATVQIGSKSCTAEKNVRITQHPIGKNPVISGVQIAYLEGGQLETAEVLGGDRIEMARQVKNIALTALTDQLAPGENDRLIFRWYVSTSKNSGGKLYINNDKEVAEDLLGPGADASETKASAVFTLRGESADGSVRTGIYDIYLVVRDNASTSESDADDRFGTDFIYFTLCVDSDC